MRRSIRYSSWYACLALFLVACGGGGGGDSSSIEYVGNTGPAVIGETNVARLVSNLIFGQRVVESSLGKSATAQTMHITSTDGVGLARLPGFLSQILRETVSPSVSSVARRGAVAARTNINETEVCDNANGSVHIDGFIEDDFSGELTLDHSNCRDGDVTLDGAISIQVITFDPGLLIPTHAIYSFSVFTLSSSAFSVSLDGAIRSRLFFGGGQTERLDIDRLISRNNQSGEMLMIRNQISIIDYDNLLFPSSLSETVNGRIYDSIHGYVDYSTSIALNYSSLAQEFPDGGQLLLIGKSNAGIRVNILSDTQVSLGLDLDGDTIFETSIIVFWSDLVSEPNFGDTDGDGMHDAWEQANGLDPGDPGDAGGDLDGDGFTNLEEYLSGSNPGDPGSTPPTADLSISKTTSTPAVGVGVNFTYTITVNNVAGVTADGVVMTDVLPAGMTLFSATPSQGSCTQTATVVCDLGPLPLFQPVTIAIEVTPTQEGGFDNTANVVSLTPDVNTANNSAAAGVSVGVPALDLQTLIDGANNGDTITVPPGIYIGSIDFNGKAITLVSMNGPLVTVIDGGSAVTPVVTFSSSEGNDSVLDGFTVRNGGDRGIRVNAASPTIQNNIVTQNTACAGAGIELAFSSAVVRQNIISNNFKSGCSGGVGGGGISIRGAGSAMVIDNQIIGNSSSEGGGIAMFAAGTPTIQGNTINGNTGGAISLVNFSDALIVNNVIANNVDGDCGGIDWLVPSSNDGPRVINNTFYGNDGSIASAICADGFDIQAEIINNLIVAKSGQTAIYCDDFNDLNPPVIEFNDVVALSGILYGGICTDQTGLNGNISADPLLVDPVNEDFRLGATSPAIDAGDNSVAGLPPTDILGNARIIDGDSSGSADIDMGAHEYTP